MKNAARIWQDMCQEPIGVDCDGEVVATTTKFGVIALSRGLNITGYGLGTNVHIAALHIKHKENREAVAAFLREMADSVEAGE